jgi:predicted dehydrogenase
MSWTNTGGGPCRIGIYGYGKVAELHAKALASVEGARLVATCGRDAGKAAAFAARHAISARASAAEMVERDGVEAILVTTPHPLHRDHAVESLEAGAHVLVEKPMALSVADCDAMVETARRRGLTLGVISQRRWYPANRRIREAIDAGKIGTPALGEVIMLGWRDEAYYRSDPWRGSWAGEGGGVLVNQAPHQLDLLTWFMGQVEEVSAYWANLNHPYIEVEDSAVASVRFASGGLASILVSNSQKPGIYAKVHVHGRNGASVGVQTDGGAMFIAGMSGILEPPVNDLWTVPGEEGLLGGWKVEDEALFSRIDGTTHFFALQLCDFVSAIRTGRPPAVSGEDGRAVVALFEAIYRSGREGRPVRPGKPS